MRLDEEEPEMTETVYATSAQLLGSLTDCNNCNRYWEDEHNRILNSMKDPKRQMVIGVSYKTGGQPFSCFITDMIPDLHVVQHGQFFPRYIPETRK